MSSAAVVNPENRAMSSIFISNISIDVPEDLLKNVLSEVGPVLNFRVFTDKSSNKSKVAFCEFKDPEIAIRAIRNLNGYEIKGQPIHVDLATSEKCRLELEKIQGNIEAPTEAPDPTSDKAPEEISKAVASLPAEQMFELMKQMKMCIENNPQEAQTLLLQNPQLAYALLQAQVIMRIVNPAVAVNILNRPTVPPAGLAPEIKTEPEPDDPPSVNEAPPAFTQGVPVVTSDQATVTASAPVTHLNPTVQGGALPGPVSSVNPTGLTLLHMAHNVVGMPNQFADQDLRTIGDQDLRTLPNIIGDRDMRAPQIMLGIDKDLRQPMGDQDFRTLVIPTNAPEARPFDPRFRNVHGSDRNAISGFERPRPANLDPRTAYDARNPGASARVEDPRKASLAAASLNARLSTADPALQSLGPNMPHGVGPHPSMVLAGMIPDEQEKAALIMQVLQLTDQQIAALPPEQRQSIMVLKEQLARSQMI